MRLSFPQMVEEANPLDERDGVLIITPQVYVSILSDIHESALNSHTIPSGVTMLWSDWGDRQYVCMIVQGANNKKKSRELCVMLRYKMLGCTTVTVLKHIICGMHV